MAEKRPLFTVTNNHGPSCGDPPEVDADDDSAGYCGYFINQHGDQCVFKYYGPQRPAVIVMGDAGWKNEYEVENGRAKGLILNHAERLWLAACWEGATWKQVAET